MRKGKESGEREGERRERERRREPLLSLDRARRTEFAFRAPKIRITLTPPLRPKPRANDSPIQPGRAPAGRDGRAGAFAGQHQELQHGRGPSNHRGGLGPADRRAVFRVYPGADRRGFAGAGAEKRFIAYSIKRGANATHSGTPRRISPKNPSHLPARLFLFRTHRSTARACDRRARRLRSKCSAPERLRRSAR